MEGEGDPLDPCAPDEHGDLQCAIDTGVRDGEDSFLDSSFAELEDSPGGKIHSGGTGPSPVEENSKHADLGARGGPLVFPGFMSGYIRVRDFHQSCNALQAAFTAQVDHGPAEENHTDEFSVADLKIMTDAMLVEKALDEVLRGENALHKSTNAGNNVSNGNADAGEPSVHLLPGGEPRGREVESEPSPGRNKLVAQPFPSFRGARKKGRPFDREERAAELMDETNASRKDTLERMKKERDLAKAKAPLRCLTEKKERENLYVKDQISLRAPKFLTSNSTTPKLASKDLNEPMKADEVILTVEIYDCRKRFLKTQEFVVCASQPLTALRDRIYCLMDRVAERAGLRIPSGYFQIEDTFYNDMRDPDATDYSKPVIEWARDEARRIASGKSEEWEDSTAKKKERRMNRKKSFSSYRAAKMENVTFMDLQFRLGKHQLYCHLGDCKHTIIFRDMRLVHPDDIQNAAAYPVLRFVHKLRHRKCTICDIYIATKVTVGDKLAPDTPCYFCEGCYFALHYDKEGTLLYDDFTVKDYFHE